MAKESTKNETKKEAVNNNEKNSEEPKNVAKSDNSKVIIAVLATILGCFVLMFVVLTLTGVIRFGGTNNNIELIENTTGDNTNGGTGSSSGAGGTNSKNDSDDKIIDNPNPRVKVNGTLATVGDLEFYLPKKFESGGKNSNGAYTYNLVDDDGWAQVVVYAEKSSLTPSQYLLKQSPYLDITDTDYEMNGTTWVQGENGSMLAYATELDGKIYAVIYSVKLDSDATSEAMSMIPKTLYMKKIYNS